jgi:uncharacterized protein (DUF362 family)
MTDCFKNASSRVEDLIRSQLSAALGHLKPRRIVLKPNWVLHETDPEFPIEALITDPRIIEATAKTCLELFPEAESILVGDCPLQSADWELLCRQCGLDAAIDRLSKQSSGKIVFRDLRKDVFTQAHGNFLVVSDAEHGDPRGYREVSLGKKSHLEPISDQAERFAVNDYSAAVTSSNHSRGDHRYLVSQSVLDADLIINLPKWKSHQKSGITCALKNLVGINGDKAYLPHYRRGAPKWGGDEFKDDNRWLYWAQTRLREGLQKRSHLAYKALKPGWELIKRLRGIETRGTRDNLGSKGFYVAGGAWWGNQTIWRMIYDLNLIIRQVDARGNLSSTPQRDYYCVVDGLVSGEGNGPLQPLPRKTDWLVFGDDPFAIDTVLGWFMGFDPQKIPIIANRDQFAGEAWGDFILDELEVQLDGETIKLLASDINFRFTAPPGWREHVERS